MTLKKKNGEFDDFLIILLAVLVGTLLLVFFICIGVCCCCCLFKRNESSHEVIKVMVRGGDVNPVKMQPPEPENSEELEVYDASLSKSGTLNFHPNLRRGSEQIRTLGKKGSYAAIGIPVEGLP